MRSFKRRATASSFAQVCTKIGREPRYPDSGGWLGQSFRPSEWLSWYISHHPGLAMFPLCPASPLCRRHHSAHASGVPVRTPGSSQETSCEGQSLLARPDPAHGLHRHSLVWGYSSFCYTDKNQQAVTQHPHCSFGKKNNVRMATKGKICMGTHGPTCALSGQWYCQERCGVWPKSLGTPTEHIESSIMRWQKWSRVFVMMWLSAVMYGMSTQSCSGMTVSICQRVGYMTGWQAILVSVTDHAFSTSSELLSKCCLTTVKYHGIVRVIKTFSKDNNEVALWITRKSSTQAWGAWQGKRRGEENIKSRW